MYNYLLIELIKKFKNQDMNAFTLIYDKYKRLIYYYSAKTRDDDTPQELTLFLLELLYSIDTDRFKLDMSDSLHKYIAVSIRNKYIYISKELQLKQKFLNEIYDAEFYTLASLDESLFVTEALSQLTLKQRLIIIYKYIHCFSDAEIADKLKISRQAVNRLKNRGINTLKEFYTLEKKEKANE